MTTPGETNTPKESFYGLFKEFLRHGDPRMRNVVYVELGGMVVSALTVGVGAAEVTPFGNPGLGIDDIVIGAAAGVLATRRASSDMEKALHRPTRRRRKWL